MTADALTARPVAWWGGREDRSRRLPVPWIVAVPRDDGSGDELGEGWLTFNPDRSRAAHERGLCQVCGEPTPAGWAVYLAYDGGRETSGPAVHARCALVALRVCPHFTGAGTGQAVAWLWKGTGHAYPEQRVLDDDGPYQGPYPLDAACVPLTAAQVRALAGRCPR